jgi:hypothetical protein
MAKQNRRNTPIAPRIEPIDGSTAAPPVPGTRQVVEDSGSDNRGIANEHGRRDDRSARHVGNAVSSIHGGAPTRNKVERAKY